ncbi:hypothetical protein [Halonatronum saccharophilum]|uniref:hypothetical protein n=1 Tax=Halonatronum saccharophilum TaxID=150060 RepID=UPI0004865BBE|nr:hypothetical protein [Halonatronum saccharophilum]
MDFYFLEEFLKDLDLNELKEARSLVNKVYKKKKAKESKKRLVDSYTNEYGVYFRLEKVFCNKDNCKKCKVENVGHGPYWYSYKNGKRKYVGKKAKEELDEIKGLSQLMRKNKDNRLGYKR